ncbi:MAG: heavy metal translocating P-type ATPase [Pseudobacter sp.]|uniref:heavy metal translocating P-type ATPase n=1 Tax=Pseudobacter sp. TaxID=2045420 RepID=UPI003F7F4EAB
METVNWKVDGMDCSNCVLTIRQFLEKKGLADVKVNLAGGDVSFTINGVNKKEDILKGIESLGYSVDAGDASIQTKKKKFLRNHKERFLFCIIFTLPLLMHMFDRWVHIHWLMNPWVQLALCLPVYIVGMDFFGRSAIKSIRNGMPNMNVLIAIGATAAFVYSLAGAFLGMGEGYLFFETAASVITLVFLGNWMEDASIQSTQRSLNKLASSQKVMANMIAYDDQHQEHVFPVENTTLRVGDILLIKNGEQVPADCKILWGDATVNESIITGESLPISKKAKDHLIGGSLLVDGTVKAYVTAEAKQSVLSNIIDLVKRAQGEKPPVQQMADRISAIFVPVVLVIAAITLIANWIFLHDFTASLMRSIAVLVIACPCAMGLATPAAIAVGLGRAARNGVLFRNAKSLEVFKNIRQVVFDKTGTLTTGDFVIAGFEKNEDIKEEEFKQIVFSLEKYSNHPIAQCIAREWKQSQVTRWDKIEEVKGIGMKGITKEGDTWQAGSFKIAQAHTKDDKHNVYILKNDQLIGWIDVKDEVRPEAMTVVQYLRHRNIRTILLSGDRYDKCKQLADFLGIDEVIAEQTPQEKLTVVEDLTLKGPTAMVGDGINDAPALAKATVGISLSAASQIAVQTADVVLMNNGIRNLPLSLGLGRHTFMTIRQNLFWAFAYNIVAIPVAAFGLLTPTFGALVMGLSDVVLAINSVRLFVKKVL